MARTSQTYTPERVKIVQWAARMGAVTDEALACRQGVTVASARARLLAAERAGLLVRKRPLVGQPALYTATRAGLRAAGVPELAPGRVSNSNAQHLIVCAMVAAALERCYPDHTVLGERELCRDERERGVRLTSACRDGMTDLVGLLPHRPDLVLLPEATARESPIAVEVELTVKAPARLDEICLAWARCGCVAGVLYLVAPQVEHALARAIERTQAGERIVLVALDALPGPDGEQGTGKGCSS